MHFLLSQLNNRQFKCQCLRRAGTWETADLELRVLLN